MRLENFRLSSNSLQDNKFRCHFKCLSHKKATKMYTTPIDYVREAILETNLTLTPCSVFLSLVGSFVGIALWVMSSTLPSLLFAKNEIASLRLQESFTR